MVAISDNVKIEGSIPVTKGTMYFDEIGSEYYIVTSKMGTDTNQIYNLFNLNTSRIYLVEYVSKKEMVELLKEDRYSLVRRASITIEGVR